MFFKIKAKSLICFINKPFFFSKQYNSIMCTCNLCVKEKQLKDNHFEYIAQKCLRYGADIQMFTKECKKT